MSYLEECESAERVRKRVEQMKQDEQRAKSFARQLFGEDEEDSSGEPVVSFDDLFEARLAVRDLSGGA